MSRTYNWRVESRGVVDRNQGRIDIIEVHLALGLEFVDVIQEAECERGAWLFQCCGKPSHTKELDTRRFLFSRLSTVAVSDTNGRDTGDVEESKIYGSGRGSTTFADMMPKLIRDTHVKHCSPGEKLA
jgi:hypothetical protein